MAQGPDVVGAVENNSDPNVAKINVEGEITWSRPADTSGPPPVGKAIPQ